MRAAGSAVLARRPLQDQMYRARTAPHLSRLAQPRPAPGVPRPSDRDRCGEAMGSLARASTTRRSSLSARALAHFNLCPFCRYPPRAYLLSGCKARLSKDTNRHGRRSSQSPQLPAPDACGITEIRASSRTVRTRSTTEALLAAATAQRLPIHAPLAPKCNGGLSPCNQTLSPSGRAQPTASPALAVSATRHALYG